MVASDKYGDYGPDWQSFERLKYKVFLFLKQRKQVNTSEKAQARTMCLCSNECSSSPVSASQSLLQS